MSQDEIKLVPVPKAPERKPRKAPGSSKVARMKERLDAVPELVVVDRDYDGKGDPVRAERSAALAAANLNAGKQTRWPNDKYYAAYQEDPEKPGVFQRVIGRRDHLPEAWKEFVEKAGSRHKKKEAEDASEPEQVEASDGEGVPDPFDVPSPENSTSASEDSA